MSIKGSRSPNDRRIAPNLVVRGVEKAIAFYESAFDARVLYRGTMPNGVTLHAQLQIADSIVMLSDETMSRPEITSGSPQKLGGVTAIMDLFVDDVDEAFARALAAGGRPLGPVQDAFYGDRVGMCVDPFGHIWSMATPTEILTAEEIHRRMLKHFGELQAT